MTEHTHWDGPGLDGWRPWHPAEAARVLSGMKIPWCVVGGWSIELALGGAHRAHSDLEIAVPRSCFEAVRDHLCDYRLHVVGDGEVRALPPGAVPPEDRHQNWVLDPSENAWRMDVMLEPGDRTTWVFRRDERISAPRARMVAIRDGIPYLRPEGALLFKAKSLLAKDEADFAACLPVLDAAARRWLIDALDIVHPDHPWRDRLTNV
jgi:hypothetical protein